MTEAKTTLPAGYSVQYDEGDASAWAIYAEAENETSGYVYVDAVVSADYEVLDDADLPEADVEAAAAAQLARR